MSTVKTQTQQNESNIGNHVIWTNEYEKTANELTQVDVKIKSVNDSIKKEWQKPAAINGDTPKLNDLNEDLIKLKGEKKRLQSELKLLQKLYDSDFDEHVNSVIKLSPRSKELRKKHQTPLWIGIAVAILVGLIGWFTPLSDDQAADQLIKVTTLQNTVNKLNVQVNELQVNVVSVVDSQKKTVTELTSLAGRIADNNQRLDALDKSQQGMLAEARAKFDAFESKVANLSTKDTEIEASIAKTNAAVTKNTTRIVSLEKFQASSEDSVAKLNKKMLELTELVNAGKVGLEESQKIIRDLKKEVCERNFRIFIKETELCEV